MMNESSLKQKENGRDNDRRVNFNFEGPIRSSAELLRRYKIKREQMAGNIERTNVIHSQKKCPPAYVATHEFQEPTARKSQNNLPTSVTTDSQAKRIDKQKVRSNRPLCDVSASDKGHGTQNNLDFVNINQSKASGEKHYPKSQFTSTSLKKMHMEAAFAQYKESTQSQDSKRQSVNASKRKLHTETTTTKSKGFVEVQDLKRQYIKRAVTEDVGVREKQPSPRKKIKATPVCGAMSIGEFLGENDEVAEEELESESEDEQEDDVEQEENAHEEEGDEINGNTAEGTSKKRTRGLTQCLKIHGRPTEDREEVELDDAGEPIGPNDEVVSGLSYFLGTIARNADFCPLIYTNFKALTDDYKDRIWEYVNDKYILPAIGKKAVFSRINDAWRRYKNYIKKKHFKKHPNLKERLKHRPEAIPEAHFRQLMSYWSNKKIQEISTINAANKAKQKYNHRMGPINFARIRARLRAKKEDGADVSQAEMFIETRQSRKGKQVDQETQTAIKKLQDSIQDSSESAGHAFQSMFGKEKPGRVRCLGRTVTPTMLKRREEIEAVKKQYSDEMTTMAKKIEGLEAIVKSLLKQNNPNLDAEALDNLMGTAFGNANSATRHSSNSSHAPNEKQNFLGEENRLQDGEREDY